DALVDNVDNSLRRYRVTNPTHNSVERVLVEFANHIPFWGLHRVSLFGQIIVQVRVIDFELIPNPYNLRGDLEGREDQTTLVLEFAEVFFEDRQRTTDTVDRISFLFGNQVNLRFSFPVHVRSVRTPDAIFNGD